MLRLRSLAHFLLLRRFTQIASGNPAAAAWIVAHGYLTPTLATLHFATVIAQHGSLSKPTTTLALAEGFDLRLSASPGANSITSQKSGPPASPSAKSPPVAGGIS